jgi:hypothetical protein
MRRRWGVRVIAILMLIAGVLLFLLGLAPAVLMAVRGTGGLEKYVAIPSVLSGCLAAFPLLVVGLVLLTLGKISDNFAAVSPAATAKRAVPAPAAVALAATPKVASPGKEAVAAAAITEVTLVEGQEAPAAAPVALAVAAVTAQEAGGETEILPAAEPLAASALAVSAVAGEQAGGQTEIPPSAEIAAGLAAPAAAAAEEAAAPEAIAGPAEGRSSQEEVSALQAQLAALQTQLDELDGVPVTIEGLPAPVEDEGPAPGATEAVKLPGADDAARIATEMAALKVGSAPEATQEY